MADTIYMGFTIYRPYGGIGYKIRGLSGSYKTVAAAKTAIRKEVKETGVKGPARKRRTKRK